MAIARFPHHYTVALDHDRLVEPPRAPIRVGAPPQFGGTDQVWSPEELLVGAVLLCIKTTFDAYARAAGVAVFRWDGMANGTLDKGPNGPVFTSIRVELDIEAAIEDEVTIRNLLAQVERACIISRALHAPVEIVPTILSHARAS